jgi:RHS repeat-associated protein
MTTWTYNSADLPVDMVYPGNDTGGAGSQIRFTYLNQMAVNTACLWNGTACTQNYVSQTYYDAAGRVELRYMGGTASSPVLHTDYVYYGWDQHGGRLSEIKSGTAASMPSNPSLQHLSYAYDDNGNVTSLTDLKAGSQVQTFTYDALDRLDSAQVTASGDGNGVYGLSDFTYDTYGRLRNNPNPGMGALSYLDSDHINAATHVGGEDPSDQRYWYDANGNMTTRKAGGLTYTLTYDAENRLNGVSQGGTTIATFVYDGDGSRVKGTVSGATTYYVGSHFEWTGSTSTMKRYIYAGGQRAGVLDGNAIYYLLSDQLGSTSVTSSYNGTKVAEVRYYPFGSDRYSTGNAHTSFRFTGQRVESGIGLYYYGARWYDSYLNRWAQPDTIVPQNQGVQAWDRYAYVNNNPVKYTDPTGHWIPSSQEGQRPSVYVPPIYLGKPTGLTSDGEKAWVSMYIFRLVAAEAGVSLKTQDWLSFVVGTEYIGAFGNNLGYNAAMARRDRDFCSDGPNSTRCVNGFWAYMQAIYSREVEKFTDWVLTPPPQGYEWQWDYASGIASAILNLDQRNVFYGIRPDMTTCENQRCEWVLVTKTQSLYQDLLDRYPGGNDNLNKPWYIYFTADGVSLLLKYDEVGNYCPGHTYCNITSLP